MFFIFYLLEAKGLAKFVSSDQFGNNAVWVDRNWTRIKIDHVVESDYLSVGFQMAIIEFIYIKRVFFVVDKILKCVLDQPTYKIRMLNNVLKNTRNIIKKKKKARYSLIAWL